MENLKQTHIDNKKHFDRRRQPQTFKPDDIVWYEWQQISDKKL